MTSAVLWFRRDLRLEDSGAVNLAARSGRVFPLFVVDPVLLVRAGPNRRRFLAGALRALDEALGATLILRRGDPQQVVPEVTRELGCSAVVATADFGPYGSARDRAIREVLTAVGVRLSVVDSPYAVAPGTVRNQVGSPMQVFGPFRRRWEAIGWAQPPPQPDPQFLAAPSDVTIEAIDVPAAVTGADTWPDLPAWWAGLPLDTRAQLPPAGPTPALQRLDRFAASALATYSRDRDYPGIAGTSGLSPYLRFGCIHPRTVLARLAGGGGADRMRAELAWREFFADVLWHRPESARHPLQDFGRHLAWDTDARARERFRSWATGNTGYPLVDAGMRQLLAEGWMHNRVRMVTASFLVKDLHLDWRLGARWFMWHLVDGDLASNQLGWQWVAGTGTDAAPFHRVLNPTRQQERFDPDGSYVGRYIGTLQAPIVDHLRERQVALTRFQLARHAAGAASLST